jgi:peroxiredoxin
MSNPKPDKPRRRRRWLSRVGEVLLFVALFAGVRAWTGRAVAQGPAPAIEGQALDGRPLSLAGYRGEPVLVHFWASWCSVCRLEEGSIQKLAAAGEHRVITVATGSGDAAKVAGYLKSKGLAFPTLVDEDGELGEAFGVTGLPTTFVVGPDGVIRFAEVGFTTRFGMLARLWWAGR